MLYDPAPIDYAGQRIVFLHIPKTAGSALIDALERRFGAGAHVRTRMQKLEKVWDSRAAALAWRAEQAVRRAASKLAGSHPLIVRGTPPCALEQARVISGHFALGEEPPSPRRPVYVTLVRDPAERFVSHFHYLHDLRERDGPPASGRDTQLARRYDLEAYVDLIASGRAIGVRNLQCRYIGGSERFEDARRAVDQRLFLAAPASRIDDFLGLLAAPFDIDPVRAAAVNVGQRRAKAAAAPEALNQRIRALFAQDAALFDYVSDAFARLRQGPAPSQAPSQALTQAPSGA
jgi:hypothetical protein